MNTAESWPSTSDKGQCQDSRYLLFWVPIQQYIWFRWFWVIVRIALCVLRNLQKIMEPCRDIPTECDSWSIRESEVPSAWAKIFPKLLWWQLLQLYPQVLFNVSLPESVLLFTIIMASPQALVQLNNSTDAERVTRKQHYNRDVNKPHVNRSWADKSAWSVTPIINCQGCQCLVWGRGLH